ncbi:MAG: tetratricopeptide repeat protein [Flavobacteriales bacterium]|nr:tetratricopeptide repeat protein [Flavobacteriales bacterium]
MKLKSLIVSFFIINTLFFNAQIKAQNYGATPEDSITCIKNLIYKDYIKTDPKLALSMWKTAYKICPGSQKSLYINGASMYKSLADKEKDEAKKELYLDTMFTIYDQRIEYFGEKGYVLGYKGQMMLVYRGKEYKATFDILNEAVQLTGDKSQTGTLVALMYATANMEKNGLMSKEDLVTIYGKLMDISGTQADEKYRDAEGQINAVAAPYLDCEVLIPLAEKGFEANKANLDWLKRMVTLLKRKKCYDADIFSKVAQAYFELEPSASGADGMGRIFWKNKDYNKAIEFFQKTVDMAETNHEKAEYTMSIAETYKTKGDYAQARNYAQKAINLKGNWGDPYLLIGDVYMQSSTTCDDGKIGKYGAFWAAYDKYQKAKAVDANAASDANKGMAKASTYFPSTQDLFFYTMKDGDAYKVECWINESTTARTK